MKKAFFSVLLAISLLFLVACNTTQKDYYFAVSDYDENSDWVYWVTIVKEGDKIVDAEWNAFNIQGDTNTKFNGLDKYEASKQGLYDMTIGRDQEPGELWWHEQADLTIEKLIQTNNVNDRIPIPAGVSITTDEFYELAEKALASDPIEKGEYVDGYYFFSLKDEATKRNSALFWNEQTEEILETGQFDYYSFGIFVVVNGRIQLAYFNAAFAGYRVAFTEDGKILRHSVDHDEDPETDPLNIPVIAEYTGNAPTLYWTKNALGRSYGMADVSGALEYDEQAYLAGDYLVEHQSFPALNDNDGFDGITGVTITTDDFFNLWKELPKS